MATDVRDQVFELRAQDPPVSIRNIGLQLGISKDRVQRILKARAVGGGSAERESPAAPPAPRANSAPYADPAIADARRATENRRLALQNTRLELEELQLRDQIALRRSTVAGGGSNEAFQLELVRTLDRMNERMNQLAAGPAPSGTHAVVQALGEMKELAGVVQTFQPARAPTSALDLEYELARDRIHEENQRIIRSQEAEQEIRRIEAEEGRARANALAGLIENVGPDLVRAVVGWIDRQGAANNRGAGNGAPAVSPGGQDARELSAQDIAARMGAGGRPELGGGPMAGSGEDGARPAGVRGYCPRCGAGELEVFPTGTDEDHCPFCGLVFAVENGEINSAGYSVAVTPAEPIAS